MQGLADTTWTWDTWEDVRAWAGDVGRQARERARRLFLFLTGEGGGATTTRSSSTGSSGVAPGDPPIGSSRKETQIGRASKIGEGGGLWGSIAGLFSGIGKGARGGADGESGALYSERLRTFEEGEVHADLVKVRSYSSGFLL